MSKTIFLKLTGGLGNQLYIASTGLALAKIFDLNLEFDINGFKRYKLHKLSVNEILPSLTLNNNIFKIKELPLLTDKFRPLNLINEYHPGFNKNLYLRIKKRLFIGDVYLKGYFQSLSYFSKILPRIKKEIHLNLNKKYLKFIQDNSQIKLEKTICYHIRRKDKLSNANKEIYGDLTYQEHIKIISKICKNLDKENLLLTGDDYTFIKDLKNKLKISQKIIIPEDICDISSQFFDLFLMINSGSLILSNSSFSLWAGYISDSNQIFFPKPIFPYPRSNSIKDLTYEDLIMPNWKPYESFL